MIFGLWGIPLVLAIVVSRGWATVTHYLNDTVDYTEPMFVVVIMALASTRPIVELAEGALRRLANLGGGTPAAWWITILTAGPLLGSFITEPAAMTIAALLLARQFYDLRPGRVLRYATLGLLFVNVSIGGTLTHFAAPPVLIVARPWECGTTFMVNHFGWRAVLAVVVSTLVYYAIFGRELRSLASRPAVADVFPRAPGRQPPLATDRCPFRGGSPEPTCCFIVWTVANAHYPALFLAGFLFFLGSTARRPPARRLSDFKTPFLVGFFLAGLIVHGALQGWWIAPILSSLTELPLFVGSTLLTAFNDNALITYLATLVPNLDDNLNLAVVDGAVTGED